MGIVLRWKTRPDDDNEMECSFSDEMARFCQTFNMQREKEKSMPDWWYRMEFDTCVLSQGEECRFIQNQGGWQDWGTGNIRC